MSDSVSAILYPYHHFLFFKVESEFYRRTTEEQLAAKKAFEATLAKHSHINMTPYTTLGFKAESSVMLWARATEATDVQDFLRDLLHAEAGQYFCLVRTFFGISRASEYSGRTGKPEQDMTIHDDRRPYFVLYPFTKTHAWYQLDPENRRSIMGQHIKTGIEHATIRQCLLYSFGVDDQEFIVSYEMNTLEEFQEVVRRMRSTIGRVYTQNDTPLFTAVYKPLPELLAWL